MLGWPYFGKLPHEPCTLKDPWLLQSSPGDAALAPQGAAGACFVFFTFLEAYLKPSTKSV